ncbi:hypothetical protein VTJ49DRAFT_1277 [Mycothermus thermophilus]|uniref:Cytochrome P450 n=1 Tax=Humicola insolens TaxID=85995 RepID=A0ABR3VCZ3_HUMIN
MSSSILLSPLDLGLSRITWSPTTTTVLVGILSFLLWRLYLALLPKPLPGIPYNHASARSILGDIPGYLKASRKTREPITWILQQASATNSPISQLFLEPFGGKPFVAITDFREAQDILMRRGKEFDRSDILSNTLGVPLPHHHIVRKTDAGWRAQRRLLQDLMLPTFLHNVAAPNVYQSVDNLVKLWQVKAKIASGRPFDADRDIYYAALDSVLEFSFGPSFAPRATKPQLDATLNLSQEEAQKLQGTGSDVNTPVNFIDAPLDETVHAILAAGEVIEPLTASPFPRLTLLFKKLFDKDFVKIWTAKDRFLKEQVEIAVDRLHKHGEGNDESWVKSAVDHVMQRERIFAAKEGRQPVYWTPIIRDEIFGFIVAGHDTSSTTMLWGLKLLADNPHAQTSLRQALQAGYATALAENRNPTVHEITHTPIPYLDAAVEEILRCSPTALGVMRDAMVDTTILGCPIPKGTHVFVFSTGPSYNQPARPVDEKLRTPSSQAAARERGVKQWDPRDMHEFKPERWLVKAESGDVAFDSTAGPSMPFSLGTRACYGRRLGVLEVRMMVALLVWNFEFLKCPEELSDYAAIDGNTHKPQRAFVRLRALRE